MSKRAQVTRSDDEVLRDVLDTQEALIAELRYGYGDERRRREIEKLRFRLDVLREQHPDVYAHAEEIRKSTRS
jgi:hypothetical protein